MSAAIAPFLGGWLLETGSAAAISIGNWDHNMLGTSLNKAGLPAPANAVVVFVLPLPLDKKLSDAKLGMEGVIQLLFDA
jgi:hypothetical protein